MQPYITFGASPRASINLIRAARALAFVRGRGYALPQDVLDMVLDVLRHRLVLSYEALSDNVTSDDLLNQILDRIPCRWCPYMNTPTAAPTPERILQRLDWQVIRRLDGLLQGDYRSLFYGYGVDFADLREYQPGDDVRYIDWNVTARMDTPYVRQYVEDREITAWFLLDLSPSMDFGTVQSLKRSVLIDFVATLARLLTRHGNRVGAMFYGSRVERTIPARGGRLQVLRLINDLLKQPQLPRAPFTDLTPLLEAGLQGIKRRSLIFVISDFISAPGWERPLSLLNQRHEVHRHPPVGPARNRAARCRPDHHGGRGDRRAALRGHARPQIPPAVSRRRRSSAKRRWTSRSSAPGWMRWRSRPTKTWSAPSCALPPCGGSAGRLSGQSRQSSVAVSRDLQTLMTQYAPWRSPML